MSIISNTLHSHNANQLLSTSLKSYVEHTSSFNIKNSVRYNNIQSATNNKIIDNNQSITKVNANTVKTSCVNNLNLSTVHLDKIKTLSTLLNSTCKASSSISLDNNDYSEVTPDKYRYSDTEEVCALSADHYQTDLITSLHNYLQNNNNCKSYVIFTFFEYIQKTKLINKQSITAIPFLDGKPDRSVIDISIIRRDGTIDRYNLPTYFHIGGYKYTKDWLNLEYISTAYKSLSLHKLKFDYGNISLNGYCLEYNLMDGELITSNTNIKLHIPGLSKIWK
ncbi:MAG: hypothetical protein ABW157_11525 [Candidatus Thiodiazotropha sp. LLP2]